MKAILKSLTDTAKALYWWSHRQRLLFKYDPGHDMMALVRMGDDSRQEFVLACAPNYKEDNWLLRDGKTVTSQQIVDIEYTKFLAGYDRLGAPRPREHRGQEPLIG